MLILNTQEINNAVRNSTHDFCEVRPCLVSVSGNSKADNVVAIYPMRAEGFTESRSRAQVRAVNRRKNLMRINTKQKIAA